MTDKKVDNRLSDQSLWSNNPLRQQNTVNNCTEQRRSGTIRDQHRSNRSLHISNLLKEALNMKKINIRIRTDSASGKSMATRIGSSKKAKHIELKHLFIQQLVAHDLVRIVKINTVNNPADIFTKYAATETLLRHISDVGINTHHH